MAQKGNIFSAFWMDTTTAPGTPLTGLSATINIRDMSGNLVVNDQPMTELGGGWYIYTFQAFNQAVDYVYDCDPNDSRCYIESGVTDNTAQLISEIRTTGGGFSVNYGTINTHTTNKVNELREELTKSKETMTQGFNDTKSHIDLAKDDINSKIDSIEIPEAVLEEKEAKKAVKLITTLDKKFTTYIDSEMKEKEEMDGIMQEFTRQEIEDMKSKKLLEEEKKKMEEEEAKKEEEIMKQIEEEVKQEFERQEKAEMEEKKKELEKELKEKEKEAEEIKKELNSIQ